MAAGERPGPWPSRRLRRETDRRPGPARCSSGSPGGSGPYRPSHACAAIGIPGTGGEGVAGPGWRRRCARRRGCGPGWRPDDAGAGSPSFTAAPGRGLWLARSGGTRTMRSAAGRGGGQSCAAGADPYSAGCRRPPAPRL